MATVRVEKSSDFTVLSNAFLDDERLSLKAVGLLGYMLRLPDDWNFTLEWLAGKHKDGLRAIRSAMEELEAAGYVTRGQSREAGRFASNDYIVREIPQGQVSPSCQNSTTVDSPSCQNAITENSTTVTILKPNTKEPSTETPPYSPPKGTAPDAEKTRHRARDHKSEPDWKPERFAAFWASYPRGEAKQAAIRAWDRLHADDTLLRRMAEGLKRQLQSEAWQENIGIPYASTWLNQRRWEDELKSIRSRPPAQAEYSEEVGAQW